MASIQSGVPIYSKTRQIPMRLCSFEGKPGNLFPSQAGRNLERQGTALQL